MVNIIWQQTVNVHIMTAICLKLLGMLGGNLQPVLDLKIQDYNENSEFFNEPSVKTFKNKTRKESELPISLFANDASEIKELIELTIKLTSLIRNNASEEDKEYLFIFMASGNQTGKVKRLSPDNLRSSIYRELSKHQILADDGSKLVITSARFRPTLINQKVIDGESLDVVKAIAGHSSVKVTQESYFNKKILVPEGNKTVSEALNKIFTNQIKTSTKSLFKTPVASCENPYESNILKSTGATCTKFNSCLSCKSLVLTIEDLPKIFNYQKSILESLENSLGSHPTLGKHYKKLLSIIDDILKVDVYFSEEELIEAKSNAHLFSNQVIDTLVFRDAG